VKAPKTVGGVTLTDMMAARLAVWAQYGGLKVDEKPFSFEDRLYLIPIYRDRAEEIWWQKSAQMGATIYMLMRLLHICRFYNAYAEWPLKVGLYFPTADGVAKMSKDRLTPLLQSNGDLMGCTIDDTQGLKRIGRSSLYMTYLGGTASKDSVPLDAVAFDEVRLCEEADINQAYERISGSKLRLRMGVSTAGLPKSDINRMWLRTDQKMWHARCHCPDGIELATTFPDCVAEHGSGSPRAGQVYLYCPKCKKEIHNPQDGFYYPHAPGQGKPSGYHISQLVSRFITLDEIMHVFRTTKNLGEFYRAKLGIPYVDDEAIPISAKILEKCVNPRAQWGTPRDGTCMGIDQMRGTNYIMIGKRFGRERRIIHFEIVEDIDPFARADQLMKEFNVACCVCDALPNANDALRFARKWDSSPGQRVWLSFWGQSHKLAQWSDQHTKPTKPRGISQDIAHRWTVFFDKYQAIDHALSLFVTGEACYPDPDALVQVVRARPDERTGPPEPMRIFREFAMLHFRSVVRESVEVGNEHTGKYRNQWKFLGLDPHALDAWTYCAMAMERVKQTFSFTFT